ncbi:MAG TPA: SDR family oxidoreductase [Terriglobales bacterium]|nr:SDR family oxidoreductase [Terriglobales bacterium]
MATSPQRPLAGKIAFVAGGARRIGRELALALAHDGADIAFTYRNSTAEARSLEAELASAGARFLAVAADFREPGVAEEAVQQTVECFGRLDILVNNLGRYETAPFEALTDGQWQEMLDTNLTAPFLLSRAAVPRMRAAGGGRIINITSIGAIRAFPTHAHYCASKAGLAHLTRAMARALAPEIQVNAVAPGLISFTSELDAWERHMCERTPLQRAGTAGDVADAVRYLAACNRFLTGQTVVVDGGLSLT